jgi:aspartyl-tRNA(Asn)/glutamyl-tRNA(Gln) amidotransferase subunit B
MNEYVTTVGIECHVQLKTKTKLFAGVDNDAREAPANTLISPLCTGMPGALPVLNAKAVELAMRAAFALGTEPQLFSKFDRKHYFYPDLPTGYQITQFEEPVILGGHVDILVNDAEKRIGITRAHLEADAGKSMHPSGKDYSLVDLNRAGTPLLEIVSEPEMHTPEEAKVYARELWLLMRYADVSEANLYYGNMRFDVNISVSKDPKKLGTRAEIKNINSFRAVEKAVEYETKRQIELLEKGKEIVQETRGWDDAKQKTFSQRTKEDAHDYRYFPDPDLPPVLLDAETVALVGKTMPTLPQTYRTLFAELGLDSSQVESLVDEPKVAAMVAYCLDAHDKKTARTIANWLTGEVLRLVSEGALSWSQVVYKPQELVKLAAMVDGAQLSSTAAKEVLGILLVAGGDPKTIATEKNLLQESNTGAIEQIVRAVLAENQKAAEDVKSGEMKAIGFLVGQVMKQSQGKANPGMAQEIIKKQLGV